MVTQGSQDSYGGPVWWIAVNRAQTYIAAACEDGCIRLFELADPDEIAVPTAAGAGLTYKKAFSKQEGRVLCVDWHPNNQDLFSGASDGTVRRWNAKTGTSLLFLSLVLACARVLVLILFLV